MRTSENEEDKARARNRYDAHLKLAETSYSEKNKDKENSFRDSECAFFTLI